MTFLGWLSDPFKGLSDLQLGDESPGYDSNSTFAFWRTKFQRTELQLAPPMQLLNLMDALEVFERRKHTRGAFVGTSRENKVYQLSNFALL